MSLWETVERVTASKELINRPFRGFPEQASIVAKKHPASSPILFSFSRAIDIHAATRFFPFLLSFHFKYERQEEFLSNHDESIKMEYLLLVLLFDNFIPFFV